MRLKLPSSDSLPFLPDMERLQAEMEPGWIWGSEDFVCAQREDLAARYSSLQQVCRKIEKDGNGILKIQT